MEAFMLWISTYAAYIQFFVQVIFWILIAFAAIWAVSIFNRYVKFMTGADQVIAPEAEKPAAAAEAVSVDKFVD